LLIPTPIILKSLAMAMLVTALVTGASRGIGRAIACRLSRDGFGVAINDLPSQKSQLEEVHAYITQQGGKAITTFANVSVESEVNQMVEEVVEQMGGLDVVSGWLATVNSSSRLNLEGALDGR